MILFNTKKIYIVYLTIFLFTNLTFSQSNVDQGFLGNYDTWASQSKEVIYLHLNKTDFLQGEQIGFKAYIVDKNTGEPASNTSNLYVQLVDEENNTIKEKFLQVKKGAAYGIFNVDKVLKPKNYIIKAFTNWSRNFETSNIFEQEIRVVDISDKSRSAIKEIEQELQVSFMPEGGHLVLNTKNTMGIYVKDADGLGVSNLKVNLLKEENLVIKTLQLNKKGFAKFLLTPKSDTKFKLSIAYKDKDLLFTLPNGEERGFALAVSSLKDSLLISLNTNQITLPDLKARSYKLAIHNGNELRLVRFPKFVTRSIVSKIAKNRLFDGINILTVLDENDTPLLERLYFNRSLSKIKYATSDKVTNKGDSLDIKLNYNDLKAKGNLSISILPEYSIANNAHESIASFNLLSSHLQGGVEDADDYFIDGDLVDEDLDLMLLIQGWSVYDWSDINYFSPETEFVFEKGIKANLAFKGDKERNIFAYPNQGAVLRKFYQTNATTSYSVDSLYPIEGDKFRISEIDRKGKFNRPYLKGKIQFFPLQIPSLKTNGKALGYKTIDKTQISPNEEFTLALPIEENTIALDEVVVSGRIIKDARLKNLIDFSFGEVTVFDESQRMQFIDVLSFIQSRNGFQVFGVANDLVIVNTRPFSGTPTVYLDGVVLQSGVNRSNNLSLLEGLFTTDIAYIETNKSGLGEGLRGGGGVIRIFTRTDYSDYFKKPYEYLESDYPLTFNKPATYSIPFYSSYSNRQYLDYGVIGWFPNLRLNDKNEVRFTIPKTNLDSIKLYIQGMLDNGDFISEKRIISLNRFD